MSTSRQWQPGCALGELDAICGAMDDEKLNELESMTLGAANLTRCIWRSTRTYSGPISEAPLNHRRIFSEGPKNQQQRSVTAGADVMIPNDEFVVHGDDDDYCVVEERRTPYASIDVVDNADFDGNDNFFSESIVARSRCLRSTRLTRLRYGQN